MNRIKLLGLMAVGLLLTNILLVLFILFRPHGGPPPKMPREIIIERLHFTDTQIDAYDKLIDWHRNEIKKTDEQILALKTKLYSSLSAKRLSPPDDSLLREIGRLQMKIETIHYTHFEEIRQLCEPEQQTDFEELLKDIAVLFSKPKREHRP